MTTDRSIAPNIRDLVAQLGEGSDDEFHQHFADADVGALIEWGADVATPRIEKDGARIIVGALTFIENASEEQLDDLGNVTKESLRLTAWAVHRGSETYALRQRQLSEAAGAVAEREALAKADLGAAVGWRDVLAGVLRKVAGKAEPYATRIEEAYSRGEDAATLADTLEKLDGIGQDLIKDRSPAIKHRRSTTRLSAAWLARGQKHLEAARSAASESNAVRAAAAVTQADVDLLDGYALTLLDEVVGSFARAHRANPTIPELQLYSLKPVLRPSRKKASEPAPDGEGGAPQGPSK